MQTLGLCLLILTTGLPVTATDWCPSSEAVQKRLELLVPEQRTTAWSAQLRHGAGGLHLSLRDRDGAIVSQRLIRGDRSCEQLASVAAAVLASWLSDLSRPVISAQPRVTSVATTPPFAQRSSAWSWEVAAAATGSLTGGAFAPGGILVVEAGPTNARWALYAMGGYDGPRQAPEGGGAVVWQRLLGGLGGTYQLVRRPFSLEVGGDLVLSDVLMRGRNFAVEGSSTSLDPGAELSIRIAPARGSVHPWLGLWATVWMRPEIPSVQGVALEAALPQLEGFLGAGLSWRSAERF